jgi:hypothetical protein
MAMSSSFVRLTWREWLAICVGARKDPNSFYKLLQSEYGTKLFFQNSDVVIEFPNHDLMTQFVLTYL